MPERVHPACTPECNHPGRKTGSLVQMPHREADDYLARVQFEQALTDHHAGKEIEYLGIWSPVDHPVHVWRIGAEPWAPMPATERTEGKQPKTDSAIYRSEVWRGDGPPGPVNFSRPAEEVEQVYPAPLATSADLMPEASPGPVADLAAYAASLGWDYMITFAHGWVPHASWGTPGKAPKKSWAVRLRRGGFRAVAVYMGSAWESAWTWSETERFIHHKGITVFKEAIR